MEYIGVYIWLFIKITLCKEYYLQLYITVRFLTVIHVKLAPCSNMANYSPPPQKKKKKKKKKIQNSPIFLHAQKSNCNCFLLGHT